jgi:hypothetical protein
VNDAKKSEGNAVKVSNEAAKNPHDPKNIAKVHEAVQIARNKIAVAEGFRENAKTSAHAAKKADDVVHK